MERLRVSARGVETRRERHGMLVVTCCGLWSALLPQHTDRTRPSWLRFRATVVPMGLVDAISATLPALARHSIDSVVALPRVLFSARGKSVMAEAASPSEKSRGTIEQPPWKQPSGGFDVPFIPQRGRTVTWYTCGPTVYDLSHLGHARWKPVRNYVSFDIVRRIMTDYFGYQVFQVMNITDIDDKIIKRSQESGVDFVQLSREMEVEFMNDMKALGVRPPDALTRVSEYVPEIIKFVQTILQRGFAYQLPEGSVYFDVEAFRGAGHFYGRLEPNAVNDEARIAEGEGALSLQLGKKRSPMDFALWKASKAGEPSWPSPWGPGRPGWHIECSAMAGDLLGHPLDIHSGGIDLKFPHHDNELAQSEAYYDREQWVNYFLHAGHLHIQGLKMSKSLKNFITIKACLERYTPRQLRMLFLMHKYNEPMDYAEHSMQAVVEMERRFNEFFLNTRSFLRSVPPMASQHWDMAAKQLHIKIREAQAAVFDALADDFNTPAAVAVLRDLVTAINAYVGSEPAPNSFVVRSGASFVQHMMKVFGLAGDDELGFAAGATVSEEEVMAPALDALTRFRDHVREAARKGEMDAIRSFAAAAESHTLSKLRATSGEAARPIIDAFARYIADVRECGDAKAVLALSDQVRDVVLPPLGIRLEDRGAGQPAMWKRDNPEDIMREVQRKRDAAATKQAAAAAAAAAREQREAEKRERAKIDPRRMFRDQTALYSRWDDQGVPTHDAAGAELSKNAIKKLRKQWEEQEALFKSAQSS